MWWKLNGTDVFMGCLLERSRRGGIVREDKVTVFGKRMAGKAGRLHRRIGGFAVLELCEPPAARRGVLSRVLDVELNVDGGTGDKRLGMAEDFVVFGRRNVTPGESDNYCAVRIRQLSLPEGLDGYVVAENDAKVIVAAGFVGHGDDSPVAVSGRNFDSEDRRSLFRRMTDLDGHTGQRYNSN